MQEVEVFYKSLPQSLTNCQKIPNLFSISWLQRIGRSDLLDLISDNFAFIKKNEKKNSNFNFLNSKKKKNHSSLHIKKNKISLGYFNEEKMLNYANDMSKIETSRNETAREEFISDEKIKKSSNLHTIKIKSLIFYNFSISKKTYIGILIYSLVGISIIWNFLHIY
jgi:hypothetical protein